jgi:hypothetical protein
MVTKTFRDPLIGGTIIKVAICTPHEAAQIVESTETPNGRLVKGLTGAGTRLREIDPAKDPDRAAFLMWLGDGSDDNVTTILKIARLVDEFGEKRRNILLPNGQVWPKEVEAHYKGQIFMRVTEALEITPIKFNKMEGEFIFDLTKERVEIEVTNHCGEKESRNGMRCYGRASRTHKEGDKSYLIELSSERLDKGLWLVWILYHETIHVKQKILRDLWMEIPEDLEDADPFLVSPKMDATIMGRLFEDALKSLL